MKVLKRGLLLWLLFSWMTFSASTEAPLGLRYGVQTTALHQKIHLLDVDPAQFQIRVAHAKEKAFGRETVEAIAKRYNAIAAINGGFFKAGPRQEGLPAGILKIQNQWYGIAYKPRAALGWSRHGGRVLMDQVQTHTRLSLNHQAFPIQAINQPAAPKKAVLYTDAFGKRAGSLPGMYDIIIQHQKIIGFSTAGHTPIPKNGSVYCLGVSKPWVPLSVGHRATLDIQVLPQRLKEDFLAWQTAETIIGGAPLLIFQGNLVQDYASEQIQKAFIEERFARTAVGILPNGHFLLVVVEQNALTNSPGMTLFELASFIKKQGCRYALNLDGGSSSTFYFKEGASPHSKASADWQTAVPIGDAILIIPNPS